MVGCIYAEDQFNGDIISTYLPNWLPKKNIFQNKKYFDLKPIPNQTK